jgi:hypothetical protein
MKEKHFFGGKKTEARELTKKTDVKKKKTVNSKKEK